MLAYEVSFMKTVPDSTGHDHTVCQYCTRIEADDEQSAVGLAIERFCREHGIRTWDYHADTLALRALPCPRPPAAETQTGSGAPPRRRTAG